MHTKESQKNFDRLISDSDSKNTLPTFDSHRKELFSSARDTSSTSNNHDEMLVSAQSRLKSDFEVIGIIGRGGFGHVFKVILNIP